VEQSTASAEERAEPDVSSPDLIFIGGTGRSGTHVVARMLGQHSSYENVPNEVRFHVDPGGFPDLLAGRTTPGRFVKRLRGRWWREVILQRMTTKGLHRHVGREALDAAAEAFLRRYEAEPEAACRELFLTLLGPLAANAGKSGLIEQSCDNIAQAPTLVRLFPEAQFVHVVRDGRDAAASRVAQARWLARPRTMKQGLRWWEERMRRIDAGSRAIPEDRYIAISLDELIDLRRLTTYKRLRRFLGLKQEPTMRGTFRREIGGGQGNVGRWRRKGGERFQAEVDTTYREILAGFERDGINGVRMLKRVLDGRAGS